MCKLCRNRNATTIHAYATKTADQFQIPFKAPAVFFKYARSKAACAKLFFTRRFLL